jgi:hypothetical protein
MKGIGHKVVTGTAAFALAGMIVLALGTPGAAALMSKNSAYAVIFATASGSDQSPITEGWALHNFLLAHGWTHSHIKFLASHPNADATPTKAHLQSALSDVAGDTDSNSLVFIAVMDQGMWNDTDYYFSASDGTVSSTTLGGWVNDISTYSKMALEVSFKYSGGFLTNLNGTNRTFVSSHASSESYSPNHYKLSVGLVNAQADTNNDGYVSFQEAHALECADIAAHYPGTQTPQKQDNSGEIILDVS